MQSGDLNRVKGPILRGLAARAPYFHNGAAASLLQAVEMPELVTHSLAAYEALFAEK